MSYTYLLEQGEEFLADSYSDIPACALSKSTNIAGASSCNGNETGTSLASQSGTTSKPSTENHGGDGSMSSAEGSPVRTFPLREKVQASAAREAVSGQKWHELSVKFDPGASSWKTHQCLWEEVLPPSSVTLPDWGMMRDGVCWERMMSVRLIAEKESGFWPTPCLPGNGGSHGKAKMREMLYLTPTTEGIDGGSNGRKAAKARGMWPTPSATDHKGSGKTGTLRDRLDYATERGATKSNTYATPQARDFRSGSTDRWNNPERSRNLNDQIGGQLNPTWVEWLMGWPLGWTDLRPLATDKFQMWLHSRGEYSH